MTKKEVVALLAETFPGVRKDALEALAGVIAIQAKTVDEAKEIVGKYSQEDVEAFAKEYRAGVDREVSDAKKTIEKNFKEKSKAQEESKPEPKEEPKQEANNSNPADISKLIADAVSKAVKPLADKLANYEAGAITKSRSEQLEGVLSKCRSEGYREMALKSYGRMSFASDDDFKAYLDEMAQDVEKFNSSATISDLSSWSPMSSNQHGGQKTASDEEIASSLSLIGS